MNRTQVERYFKVLAGLYPKRCRIILTGAAAGSLYGRVRATLDIDFAVRTADWPAFEKAVRRTTELTGILAQYGEDIDRWSMISYLDYDKHTRLYKKIGSLKIRLMEPSYWAIGKLARYLDTDIRDLISVLKRTATPWTTCLAVAGRALKHSPKSTACALYRRQVEDFIRASGKKVWGRDFQPDPAVRLFRRSAGIPA
ncbi:MAG: hypothetical protein MOGMAGMI_02155 [Candidatus Omnitrophica bacterium]|nr:hypothetical protein [Candidatus Omnitrophota bacterium]